MTVHRWRDGAGFGVAAEAAGAEVGRIEARDGVCTPAALVEESRPEDAPLHPAFEWDDPVAAERWREHQARGIIRSIEVVREGCEPTIAFVSVRTEHGRGYVDTASIAASAELHEAAKAEALAALRGWTRRYRHIVALDEVIFAVERAIDEAERDAAPAPRRRRAAVAAPPI